MRSPKPANGSGDVDHYSNVFSLGSPTLFILFIVTQKFKNKLVITLNRVRFPLSSEEVMGEGCCTENAPPVIATRFNTTGSRAGSNLRNTKDDLLPLEKKVYT